MRFIREINRKDRNKKSLLSQFSDYHVFLIVLL